MRLYYTRLPSVLTSVPLETSLLLRVQPGARRSEIAGWHGDALRLRIAVPPERGKANTAVIDLLAASLNLPRNDVRIVRGFASRDKVALIAGLDGDELNRRLQTILDAAHPGTQTTGATTPDQ